MLVHLGVCVNGNNIHIGKDMWVFFGYSIHEIHPLVDITTLLGKKLPELCDFLHGKSPTVVVS